MRTAEDEEGVKLFITDEYLRREQIASFFSCLTSSRRKNGQPSSHEAINECSTEEDICEVEHCLEDMEADDEMLGLQESLATVQEGELCDDEESDSGEDADVGNSGCYEVRKGVEGEVIKVYPDGGCMFRSIAVYLDQTIQKCKRTDLGWPMLPENATTETTSADKLRKYTVEKMAEMLDIFEEKK